jgi:hypothetical protein
MSCRDVRGRLFMLKDNELIGDFVEDFKINAG